MFYVLLRAISFAFIIVIGIFMRSKGLVPDNAGDAVKKFLLYITLPCAIIVNFSSIETIGSEMILVALLGLLANIIMVAVGVFITKKKAKDEQTLYILCLPAFNIGAFCIPFVQSFLPALGTITACMFDVGNGLMCTGGTYAFVTEYTAKNKSKLDIKSFFKKLMTSPPLVTNIVMFLLAMVHIKLPQPFLTFIDPMAKANTFIAMLMLGLLFHLELKKDYLNDVIRIIVIRHIFAAICALVIYFLLPFDLIIRQTLVLTCFAPMSAVAPAYTGMCGGDEGKASCANSLTILCSLVTITALIAVMGLN